MDKVSIENILLEISGQGLMPERGVGTDDVLLNEIDRIPDSERGAFWSEFGLAFKDFWVKRNILAVSNAASFIERMEESDIPPYPIANSAVGFLWKEQRLNTTTWDGVDDLRLRVAGLCILSRLELASCEWWGRRLKQWLKASEGVGDTGKSIYVWQAVLHANRALVRNWVEYPDLATWFKTAVKARVFPALELFHCLADTSDKFTDDAAKKEEFKRAVVKEFRSALNGVDLANQSSLSGLRLIVKVWMINRLGMTVKDADGALPSH